MKLYKLLTATLFALTALSSYAQGEYILEIIPETGAFIRPDKAIKETTWVMGNVSTYDEVHGLYIFPQQSPSQKLVSVNSEDSVFNNPSFTYLSECQYDNASEILYGLQRYSGSPSKFVFGTFDPATANFSAIDTSPVAGLYNGYYQGSSAFDKNNHVYMILGTGPVLFSIDALSGAVLSKPTISLNPTESIMHICYDDSTNKLYGLVQNNKRKKTFFVEINTSNGQVTQIGDSSAYGFGGGTATIDRLNRRYMYHYSVNKVYYLTVVDIKTGNVLYNNIIPINSAASLSNINSIEYDNVKKKLYAQHWYDPVSSVKSIGEDNSALFYPNPAGSSITIKAAAKPAELILYNVLGEEVLRAESKTAPETVDISGLPAGVYMVRMQGMCGRLIKN